MKRHWDAVSGWFEHRTGIRTVTQRFLYEDIAFQDLPAPMRERAQSVDAAL